MGQDWGENFPCPSHWVILFLAHPCFLKGKWDCGVCSLLSPGGRVWKRHLAVPRWTCHILSVSHKSQENQLQDQHRGHNTSSAPTGRQKCCQGLCKHGVYSVASGNYFLLNFTVSLLLPGPCDGHLSPLLRRKGIFRRAMRHLTSSPVKCGNIMHCQIIELKKEQHLSKLYGHISASDETSFCYIKEKVPGGYSPEQGKIEISSRGLDTHRHHANKLVWKSETP